METDFFNYFLTFAFMLLLGITVKFITNASYDKLKNITGTSLIVVSVAGFLGLPIFAKVPYELSNYLSNLTVNCQDCNNYQSGFYIELLNSMTSNAGAQHHYKHKYRPTLTRSLLAGVVFLLPYILITLVKERRIPYTRRKTHLTAQQRHEIYLHCLAGMLAKLAKSDGRVCEAEINVMNRFMQERLKLTASDRAAMIERFKHARDSDRPFATYLSEFMRHFRHDRQFKTVLLQILIEVAEAGEKVEAIEVSLVFSAARVLDLESYFFASSFYTSHKMRQSRDSHGTHRFNRFQRSNQSSRTDSSSHSSQSRKRSGQRTKFRQNNTQYNSLARHYEVLGCRPSDSVAKIKKKYRSLIVQYHPDKLVSQGLPESVIEIAKEKFIETQRAYESIMEIRES